MAKEKVKPEESFIEATGYFNGVRTKKNFEVQLSAKFNEMNLADSLQFIAGIGKPFVLEAIEAETDEEALIPLGTFTIGNIKVDRNGNSIITFKSDSDQVAQNNFVNLMREDTAFIFRANIRK